MKQAEKVEEAIKQRYQQFLAQNVADSSEKWVLLTQQQSPHTLFITCSDSRIVPEQLLQADVGEIFHVRSIANIIPDQGRVDEGYGLATLSAIEFAVNVLNVERIILCGHSNCGGCHAAMHPDEALEDMPSLKSWISQLMPLSVQVKMEMEEANDEVKAQAMETLNIKRQHEHLMALPTVKDHVQKRNLAVYAWYYHVGTGKVDHYDAQADRFIPLDEA